MARSSFAGEAGSRTTSTLSFDLARALRRIKPQRTVGSMQRRRTADLPLVQTPIAAGAELLLDTCVYIDVLQGRTPANVDDLLEARILNHSTVCLAELTHLFGRLDPAHASTRTVLREIRRTIEGIPSHRLSAPSTTAMGEAGMLAGLVARLSGIDRGEGASLLNDANLYLQALERGWILLTRNAHDFDFVDQLLPASRVLFYEHAQTSAS
jgi:predicted nucleic acid-binding protein